uniref:RRP15-like protein n=2 Tax=Meloidogyne incognita group TaxID=654580 RepID=A0A915MIZ9_MELJA
MDAKRQGYVKPDYGLDKERERKLTHVATRGVTQLFNAVTERQAFCKDKLEEMAGKPMKERKRILEELKEYNFNNSINKSLKKAKIKLETKKEEKEEETDVGAISSGVEDTDIEIKEEEEEEID